jgi:hypothetical protein
MNAQRPRWVNDLIAMWPFLIPLGAVAAEIALFYAWGWL